jgi:hypothetical protein
MSTYKQHLMLISSCVHTISLHEVPYYYLQCTKCRRINSTWCSFLAVFILYLCMKFRIITFNVPPLVIDVSLKSRRKHMHIWHVLLHPHKTLFLSGNCITIHPSITLPNIAQVPLPHHRFVSQPFWYCWRQYIAYSNLLVSVTGSTVLHATLLSEVSYI